MDIAVINNTAKSRYEALVHGEVAGFAEYVMGRSTIEFTHTYVETEFEGKGVASTIVRTSLDDVRDSGTHRVIATCEYYQGWIGKHPEYQELLAQEPGSLA